MAMLPSVVSPRAAELEDPGGESLEDKESDGRSWLSRMAGRRLGAPFRGRKVPSLAEWLADRAAPHGRAAPAPGPGLALEECQAVLPAGLGGEGASPATSSRDAGHSPSRGKDEKSSSRGSNGSRGQAREDPARLLGTATGARRRKDERRRLHTTVRGGLNVEAAAALWELESEDEVNAGSPREDGSQSKVATLAELPATGLPSISPSYGSLGRANRGAAPWGSGGLRRRSLGGSFSSSLMGFEDKSKLILPRVPAQQKPQSGSVATMHASADCASKVLSRYRGLSPVADGGATAAGEDQPTDRKWLLRQASLSATMAAKKPERVHKPARNGDSAEPNKEYLSFEGWGLDDDYVCTLLDRTMLARMRFINMSENRLTEATLGLLAGRGREQPLAALESLHFRSNRLGPAAGRVLAQLFSEAKPPLLQLDLSDNALGDQACEELCEALTVDCRSLVGLCLARTDLGHSGRAGNALGVFVGSAKNLQALDLHWNWLHGAGAAALLQGMQDNCHQPSCQLWRVNLAWNRLGARCNESQRPAALGATRGAECRCEACRSVGKVVTTLASIFAESKALFHLDLSYNSLRAADCTVLGDGLKNNHSLYGLHLAGNEATIDDVGFVVPATSGDAGRGLQEVVQREGVRGVLNESVRHTPLFLRLDRLGHLNDRSGLGPVPDKAREMAVGCVRANPSLTKLASSDAFSKQDLETEKEWVDVHAKVQRLGDYTTQKFEDVRLNEHCCWICENWVHEEVSYIPGWSGPEASAEETTEVFAYFSIDGFARPTRLQKTTERFFARHFGLGQATGAQGAGTAAALLAGSAALGVRYVRAAPDGSSRRPLVDAQGRYVVFKGGRMLPPSVVPMKVIFQVNQSIVCADHMATDQLAKPLSITLHSDGRSSESSGPLPPLPTPLGTAVEAERTNIICVGVAALQRFEQGMAHALCLVEDPRHRGGLELAPRRLQREAVERTRGPWSYQHSVFRDYHRESEELFAECFDRDFEASKLPRYLEAQLPGQSLGTIRSQYGAVIAAFHGRCFKAFSGVRCSAGLTHLGFAELLGAPAQQGEPEEAQPAGGRPQQPGRQSALLKSKTSAVLNKKQPNMRRARHSLIMEQAEDASETESFKGPVYCKSFPPPLADTIFVAASVLDKNNPTLKEMAALPAQGLARFQFLEALAKVALARFLRGGEQDTAEAAMKRLLQALRLGQDQLHWRSTLQQALFCEECCSVLWQHRKILEQVFAAYSRRLRFPGRASSGLMAYSAWIDFLQACDAEDFGVAHGSWGLAFALGREVRVDEFRSFRHMELSWSEFLVCIGAAVRLSGGFSADSFPDKLLEFVELHVSQALQAAGLQAHRYTADPSLSRLVTLAGQAFEEADIDHSGFLSQQDFYNVLRKKDVVQTFREAGMGPDDFRVLFARLDATGSGTISLDELCGGLVRMKRAMQGQERVVTYMRRIFEEADHSDMGSMPKEDFNAVLTKPAIQTKLQMLGVSSEDVEDLWAAIDAQDYDGRAGITGEDVVACFLSLREEGGTVARGMNFLRQVFKIADDEGSGMLSRIEVKEAFCTDDVTEKLERLGLTVPDWLEVFDAMDVDGDKELSSEDFLSGISAIWMEADDD